VKAGRDADWLELLSELFTAPLIQFPVEPLAGQLRSTLGGTAVSWNVRDEHANTDAMFWLPEGQSAERNDEETRRYVAGGGLDRHPLLQWAAVAGTTPQTMSRVPPSISPTSDRDACREVMRPLGVQEQLAVPLVISGPRHAAFVVARPEEDFAADDLALARHVQPLLFALWAQVRVLSAAHAAHPCPGQVEAGLQLGLTGRQVAVLELLATGLTSTGIARRLSITSRTAEKHLERIYRKLGVNDRLSAVLVAHRAGALRGGSGVDGHFGGHRPAAG
jgi:DNA-binding CsgD family transcriptional regulator